MKLLPTLTLILFLHIPLMHSTPFINEKNRDLIFVGAGFVTSFALLDSAVHNYSDRNYYDHKIRTEGLTAKRMDKRDAACTKATVSLIAGILLAIYSAAYIITIRNFDPLGNIAK